jgi:hypothetical protein
MLRRLLPPTLAGLALLVLSPVPLAAGPFLSRWRSPAPPAPPTVAAPARPPAPPPPRLPPRSLPVAQTVTPAQVEALFRVLAGRRDIAFHYPADGCYARAHLMLRHLQHLGLHPYKVWAFADGEDLEASTPHHPEGRVSWDYHVAPALCVRFADASQRWYVLDPSLFDRPVPVERWVAALRRSPASPRPYVTFTRPGEAPTRPSGVVEGSGYWPEADPPEGLDAHAAAAMRRFKPYEDRLPPPSVSGGEQAAEPAATSAATATGRRWRLFRRH